MQVGKGDALQVYVKIGIDLKSLIKYFAVPKGGNDIHIVYDTTVNKLN